MPRLQAADRRRQLLEVAADLFARRGFGGTTTAESGRVLKSALVVLTIFLLATYSANYLQNKESRDAQGMDSFDMRDRADSSGGRSRSAAA